MCTHGGNQLISYFYLSYKIGKENFIYKFIYNLLFILFYTTLKKLITD